MDCSRPLYILGGVVSRLTLGLLTLAIGSLFRKPDTHWHLDILCYSVGHGQTDGGGGRITGACGNELREYLADAIQPIETQNAR